MKNNILIFSTAYLPFIGGAEIAVKELTDRLTDFEFDLITARLDKKLPSQERLGRVNVQRVGLGNKFDKFLLPVCGLWRALSLNRIKQYQVIFSVMASQASIAAVFFKILKPKKKLLLNLQEGDEEDHLKRYVFGSNFFFRLLIRPWHLLVFKKADLVTALSGYLKDRALGNGVKCPIEVVPNGVEVKKFLIFSSKHSEQLSDNFQLENSLGFKESDRILITASRLVKKNAVGDIIKSLGFLPENVKLLILGGGPDENMLRDLAKKLKLDNRIIFMGAYNNDDLPKYLAISDIFIRPSLSEGQGISFLEAMAAGVPIIGTPVGGITDFLADGTTGLFCQVGTPKSIAEKAELILNDKNLRDRLTANASRLVKEKYDWNIIVIKMNNIFRGLIADLYI